MPNCQDCKSFFPIEDEEAKGDCVQRVVDPRQAYYKAKPVQSDAEACESFQKK